MSGYIKGKDEFEKNLEIKKLVNKGGFGEVFTAIKKDNEEKVAVKKAINKTKGNNYYSLEKEWAIIREKNIDHPNIVRHFEFYTFLNDQGEREEYGVMEFLEGGTIRDFIASRPSQDFINKILIDVLKGIKHLHQQDLIHRDISPDNIMLDQRGDDATAKLIDLGVAKRDATKTVNAVSSFVGKDVYMSPEQRGKQDGLNKNTDLWSFGVIIHELFVGTWPYQAHQNFAVEPISKKILQIPEPYRSVVIACLVQKHDKRIHHRNIDLLIDALENSTIAPLKKFKDHIFIEDQQKQVTEPYTNPPSNSSNHESYQEEDHIIPSTKKKWLTGILIGILLLSGGLAATWYWPTWQCSQEYDKLLSNAQKALSRRDFSTAYLDFTKASQQSCADDMAQQELKKLDNEVWQVTLNTDGNEVVNKMMHSSDGGVVVVGQRGNEGFIAKYNVQGEREWTKAYDEGEISSLVDIIETKEGNYLAVGEARNTNGNSYPWTVAIDDKAGTLYTQRYPNNEYIAKVTSIIHHVYDKYLILGVSDRKNDGKDRLIIQIDDKGEEVSRSDIGPIFSDEGIMASTSYRKDQEYAIAGFHTVAGKQQLYIGKFEVFSGNQQKQWDIDINQLSSKTYESSTALAIDTLQSTSGYMILGESYAGGKLQYKVYTLTEEGAQKWEFPRNNNYSQYTFTCITSTADGGCLVGGSKTENNETDAVLLKIDKLGYEEWEKVIAKEFDIQERVQQIAVTPFNNILVLGEEVNTTKNWLKKIQP